MIYRRFVRVLCAGNGLVLASGLRRMSALSMTEAITKAEHCLGYSVKDFSVKQMSFNQRIQALMSDKALSMPEEHPVLLAERKLDPEIEVNYKSRSLLALLLSKVVSESPPMPPSPQYDGDLNLNTRTGFTSAQLLLAETIELIYGGCVFHSTGISPIKDDRPTARAHDVDLLLRGNRLSILRGDLLLSSATKNLVQLKSQRVSDAMSRALREFIEGEYAYIKSREVIETGQWEDILENWVRVTGLRSASLVANGCQSMAHLSANCERLEESVYNIGHNIGFAWSVSEELDNFYHLENQLIFNANSDLLYTLPILLHLNASPGLNRQLDSCENYRKFIESIREDVGKGDAIMKMKSLIDFYCDQSLAHMEPYGASEAKTALTNIVLALKSERTLEDNWRF